MLGERTQGRLHNTLNALLCCWIDDMMSVGLLAGGEKAQRYGPCTLYRLLPLYRPMVCRPIIRFMNDLGPVAQTSVES